MRLFTALCIIVLFVALGLAALLYGDVTWIVIVAFVGVFAAVYNLSGRKTK